MKRLLLTGAGGAPMTNFLRSLRVSPEKFYMVGTDSNKYYLHRSEADENYMIPSANEPDYIDFLNFIIDKTKPDFMHVQNDAEIEIISKNREKFNVKTFLPAKKTVDICLNKYESYKRWKKYGIKQPGTMVISDAKDLDRAFESYGMPIWLRDTKGAGGKGSIMVDDVKSALSWLDIKKGWGKYTAAEYLSPDSVTWMSIWNNGELVVAQSRRRIYWELSKLAISGITGATGCGVTIADKVVDKAAMDAIYAIDKKPNGIFSVDMTNDRNGHPNPTEINIGRFFTTHEFFTKAGLNMPYIFIKTAFGEPIPKFERKLNPLKEGLAWIRGIDMLPVLTTVEVIKATEDEFNNIRSGISSHKK